MDPDGCICGSWWCFLVDPFVDLFVDLNGSKGGILVDLFVNHGGTICGSIVDSGGS